MDAAACCYRLAHLVCRLTRSRSNEQKKERGTHVLRRSALVAWSEMFVLLLGTSPKSIWPNEERVSKAFSSYGVRRSIFIADLARISWIDIVFVVSRLQGEIETHSGSVRSRNFGAFLCDTFLLWCFYFWRNERLLLRSSPSSFSSHVPVICRCRIISIFERFGQVSWPESSRGRCTNRNETSRVETISFSLNTNRGETKILSIDLAIYVDYYRIVIGLPLTSVWSRIYGLIEIIF